MSKPNNQHKFINREAETSCVFVLFEKENLERLHEGKYRENTMWVCLVSKGKFKSGNL